MGVLWEVVLVLLCVAFKTVCHRFLVLLFISVHIKSLIMSTQPAAPWSIPHDERYTDYVKPPDVFVSS